jgi:hypothetical protein
MEKYYVGIMRKVVVQLILVWRTVTKIQKREGGWKKEKGCFLKLLAGVHVVRL